MCGGYSLTKGIKKVSIRFGLKDPAFQFTPRYNARPGQNMPVILNQDPDKIQLAHWGITPFWAKAEGQKTLMINARLESVDKPAFKKDFLERRCLVIADGFYEWEKTNNGKQPHYFKLKSSDIFAMAGIWEMDAKTGKASFTILTMEPNGIVGKVHDRMPVILKQDLEKKWLTSKEEIHTLTSELKPYPENEMDEFMVSRKVNVAYNDYPDLIKPL